MDRQRGWLSAVCPVEERLRSLLATMQCYRERERSCAEGGARQRDGKSGIDARGGQRAAVSERDAAAHSVETQRAAANQAALHRR